MTENTSGNSTILLNHFYGRYIMGIVIPFAKTKGYTYNHNYVWSIDPTFLHVGLPLACSIIIEVQSKQELYTDIKERGYLWAFSCINDFL